MSPPSSPPRRVVSEFKPFAAGGGLSVADAPMGIDGPANYGGGGGGQNDATKSTTMNADEELAQSVELRFAGISLEQVSFFPLL